MSGVMKMPVARNEAETQKIASCRCQVRAML